MTLFLKICRFSLLKTYLADCIAVLMKKRVIVKKKKAFVWGYLTFSDPYKVIKQIFSFANIDFYRDFISDILLSSSRKKPYKKGDAGQIMFIMDGIFCLLQAGFAMSKKKKRSLLDIRDADIINSNFYTLGRSETAQWTDFPRSLSKDEVLDPYRAFGKLFRHCGPDKLYNIMKQLMEDACGSYSTDSYENTFEIYVHLTKLFEAAHLIYVRELEHVRNWRLNRINKN